MPKTGTIKIVDRRKDLVKLQMGEYVSLSKVSICMHFLSKAITGAMKSEITIHDGLLRCIIISWMIVFCFEIKGRSRGQTSFDC